MTPITPEQAREYVERWKLVRKAAVEELRTTSMETKLQQLAVLMASRGLFPNARDRERQVVVIRDRWAQIRKALRG
jgi:hypothetical protein